MADSSYLHGGAGSLLAPNFWFCHLFSSQVFHTFYQVVFLNILEKYSKHFLHKMYLLIFDQTFFVFSPIIQRQFIHKKNPNTTAAFHVQFQNGKSADLSNVFIMKLIKKNVQKQTHFGCRSQKCTQKTEPVFFFFFKNTISPSDAIADVRADV